jgi:hypothetical protein
MGTAIAIYAFLMSCVAAYLAFRCDQYKRQLGVMRKREHTRDWLAAWRSDVD